MNLSKVFTRAEVGLNAPKIAIETHISRGLPSFNIVGLPETVVRESKERVRSAIINANFKFPVGRITISLTPANLPKVGARYDLPIAIGILLAAKQIKTDKNLNKIEFYGELSLYGAINAVSGLFAAALSANKINNNSIIVPTASDTKLAIIKDINILTASSILEVCDFLVNNKILSKLIYVKKTDTRYIKKDFAEVKGQMMAKRALEVAAAGGHNLLLIGTPGAGKTMLAERFVSIMPPMTFTEMLEVTAIYSVVSKKFIIDDNMRAFRSPHHLSSAVALIGGGLNPQPGEISLAHNGVLFLDELLEFPRYVLEVLRQPMESGVINISRAKYQVEYPANFQLIAAMNPCPCGYYGDGTSKCHCTADQIDRYKNKISGPLLDRIDIVLSVPPLPKKVLLDQTDTSAEPSKTIRERVLKAHNIQLKRQGKTNDKLTPDKIDKLIPLNKDNKHLLEMAIDKFHLSARAYHRILKVARTIADLDNSDSVNTQHLTEAISYRRFGK